MTRPLRTVIDFIEAGNTDEEFLRQMLIEGMNRGLITRSELKNRRVT